MVLDFKNFSPEELSLAAEALSVALSKDKDSSYLDVLGNFLVSVGSSILTIAAQIDYLEKLASKENNTNNK